MLVQKFSRGGVWLLEGELRHKGKRVGSVVSHLKNTLSCSFKYLENSDINVDQYKINFCLLITRKNI